MPRIFFDCDRYYEYANDEELLEFCNRVRELGGSNNLLGELPLSVPSEPDACLIARSLNFNCMVEGSIFFDGTNHHGDSDVIAPMSMFINWYYFEDKEDIDKKVECARKIAEGLNLRYHRGGLYCEILLPPLVMNAVHAFDQGIDFERYVSND